MDAMTLTGEGSYVYGKNLDGLLFAFEQNLAKIIHLNGIGHALARILVDQNGFVRHLGVILDACRDVDRVADTG
ncbi:MAG: hypothetical protein L0287_34190, partial [Anaerolineae bacterium]|nr:hypothetical protein [Anaerolineae bacterium]